MPEQQAYAAHMYGSVYAFDVNKRGGYKVYTLFTDCYRPLNEGKNSYKPS